MSWRNIGGPRKKREVDMGAPDVGEPGTADFKSGPSDSWIPPHPLSIL